ncbi:MAG: hypothetical protein IKD96_03490 [Oscillospiraceae bacterium]|nr:hypothetical protein [Oscillospiraceae bacterium]
MIRRIINNKIVHIVFALLLALLLWFYVVNQENPDDVDLVFRDVVIQYEGEDDILASENLSITSDNDTIDLRLEGKRRELLRLDSSDLYLVVDVSNIDEPGTYSLPYRLSLPLGISATVSEDSPQEITVTVSRFAEKSIPVTAVFNGSVATGYLADDNISVYPDSIVISGREEDVAQVDHALVTLSGSGLRESIVESMPFTLVDADGNTLSFEDMTLSREQVTVKFPILLQKKVPLTVALQEGGGATEANVSWSMSQDSLHIAAEEDVLNTIDSIELGVIDLAQVEENGTYLFPITLPEGVRNLSGVTEIQVDVTVRGLATKQVETTNISCINVTERYTASVVTDSLTVTLRGPEEDLAAVTGDNVLVDADLSEIGGATGIYTVPAVAHVEGSDTVGVIGTYKVTVSQKR